MAEGLTIVHYEVYTLIGGRWELHARYRREEREKAIDEGKVIERSLNRAVKVVRDTYSPSNNDAEEAIVYVSDKSMMGPQKRTPVGAVSRRDDDSPRGGMTASGGKGGAAARAARPTSEVFGPQMRKLMVILATSVICAGGVTAVMSVVFANYAAMQTLIDPQSMPTVNFFVFVGTFLFLAVPMAMAKIDVGGGGARPVARMQPRPMPKPRPKPVEEIDEEEKKEEEKPEEEKEEEKKEEEETPPEAVDPGGLETERKKMLDFLGALLAQVKKAVQQVDAYNLFGINLMLAGAVDVLGQKENLNAESRRALLQKAIEAMGTKAETAKTFSEKHEDYLVEPRYLGMIQSGRSTMESFLNSSQVPTVGNVFNAWNKPQAAQAQAQIMTVMFTDMVGSTDMTQAMGDKGAQEIVRRHNSIVRTVLSQYQGKEIKHTGDGIMASFNSAANGVDGAIAIQRLIAAHNQKYADLPLHVRIGVNAGEPIQEEDDLFGSTVQIAARVCAFAGKDQIMITNVVRELASNNKAFDFTDQGPQSLKGIKERMSIYEVRWQT